MTEGFEIPQDKLLPSARLKEDLELDSLDAIDMLVYLEDELSVKVDIERFKEARTLEDVYGLIGKLAKESNH